MLLLPYMMFVSDPLHLPLRGLCQRLPSGTTCPKPLAADPGADRRRSRTQAVGSSAQVITINQDLNSMTANHKKMLLFLIEIRNFGALLRSWC